MLKAAQRIFSQKGYHNTSIDDLIVEADIARGTFYLYFESKRAIFDELLDGLVATLQSSVRRIEIGAGAAPPVQQMDETVDRVLELLLEHREIARILLREAVGIDADFDAKLAQFYGRIEVMIATAVETGQQMGLVRDCEPFIVARCVLGSLKEVIHYAFVAQDPTKLDLRHLGREVVAYTLKGLFKSA